MALSLLEAFRTLGPLEGDAQDVARFLADGIVQEEIERLARRLTYEDDIREEAARMVSANMIAGGTRGTSALSCDSDEAVQRFLRRCLSNMAASLWRQRAARKEDEFEAPDREATHAAPGPLPLQLLMDEEQRAEAFAVEQRFHDIVVPACEAAIKPQYRQDFRQSVAHMRALAFEEVAIDEVVQEATGRSGTQAEAAVHQRHHRARERLLDYIADQRREGRLTDAEARQYRACVSFLQRRASSSREAARAAVRDQR